MMWKVETKTNSSVSGAGTDKPIYIEITGANGKTTTDHNLDSGMDDFKVSYSQFTNKYHLRLSYHGLVV